MAHTSGLVTLGPPTASALPRKPGLISVWPETCESMQSVRPAWSYIIDAWLIAHGS